jgi:hypothetical protein
MTVESRSLTPGNTDQYQYFALSIDNTGIGWQVWRITLSEGTTTRFCKAAAANFWDYPMAGRNNGSGPTSRWFITANDFDPTRTSAKAAILAIGKAETVNGLAAIKVTCFPNLQPNLAAPIVLDSSTVASFLSPGSGSGSSIARYNLTASSSGPASDSIVATTPITIPAWTAAPNATQPGTTSTLDSLDGRFQSPSIQSRGLLWNVHTIASSGLAKIRMYRVSTTGTSPLTTFTPTLAGVAAHNLFNPSVTTGSGAFNAPVFFAVSRTIPSDPTFGKPSFITIQGLNASTSSSDWNFTTMVQSAAVCTSNTICRWGDYSSSQVDPAGTNRAWMFNQLMTGTSQFQWTTRAAQSELNLTFGPVARTP